MPNCNAHCRSCGRCFTGTKAFDAHRVGSHKGGTRHCADPEKSWKLTEFFGKCKISGAGALDSSIFGSVRGA